MSYEPESYEPETPAAAEKTKLPAIFLIVTSVINILISIYFIFNGVIVLLAPADVLKQGMQQQSEMQKKNLQDLEKQGISIDQLKNIGGGFYLGLGGVAMILSLITLMGAIRMLSLKSYGLALTGSVLAMIPCLSPCCVLGLPFGIWSMIVLMNPEVKSAFR